MDIERLLKSKREEILDIAARHGATNVRIFGSASRAEAGRKVTSIFWLTSVLAGPRSFRGDSRLIWRSCWAARLTW